MDSMPAFHDARCRSEFVCRLVLERACASSALSFCRPRSWEAAASQAELCGSSESKSSDSIAAGEGLLSPALKEAFWGRV